MHILKKYWVFLILVLFSVPAAYQLLGKGFYEPSDLHHIADIYQMFRAFVSGQIPGRLGPDFTFGWGYPLFNFYYVLPFYIGALWFYISGSLTWSFKLVFILSIFISTPAMYLFLKQYFKKLPSFVGAILYLYTPFRALEIYVRGAIGEALAISLLPLAFYVLSRVAKDSGKKNIAIAAIVLALFFLSHNYLWILAAPWIILFFVKTKPTKYLGLAISSILAAGLSIYWWLPAIIEQKYVSAVTPFPLIDHFPFIKQLLIPSWGYGASVAGPGDGISFQIGLVNLFAIVAAAIIIVFYRKLIKKENIYLIVWALVGFFVTFSMMNIRSYPIWKLLPIYNFVQFPWRLLFLTTFFSAFAIACVIEVLPEKMSKVLSVVVIIFSIALTINYFKPSKIFYKNDNQYLSRMFANRTVSGEKSDVSLEYYNWSEDYLLLPVWADKRPVSLPTQKIEGDKVITVSNIKQISVVHWSANIDSKAGGVVTYWAYYFPGWFSKVDGRMVDLHPGKPYGQILVNVPEGKHFIEFYWAETDFRKKADYISLVSLVIVLALLVLQFKRE